MDQTQAIVNVNRTAGFFVLLVVIVLVAALALVTKAKRLFEKDFDITIILPKEGTFGVSRDDEVHILHLQAGSVTTVDITEDGVIKANLSISPEFARFVRRDSVAVIRRGSLLLEKVIVDITRGQAAPLPSTGAQIPCVVEPDLMQTVHDTVRRVAALIADIEKGKGLLGKIVVDETMADDVTTALGQVDGILAAVKATIEQTQAILKTTAAFGDSLLTTAEKTNTIAAAVPPVLDATGQALTQVKRTLEDMQKTLATFRHVGQNVQDDITLLPALMLQTQSLLLELENLVRGIENSWFLRDNIPKPTPPTRIPARRVQP
ncbi:MlaD family protein [Desulfovibrio inopinatus]|uniref:MlaD family protein n=1 Tax=Desulfovibrio inopinatus TaxID=102109 RepID=UPI000423C69A|nr:MlaD family protein [Desulfovibrio inopinatus]